MHGTTTVMSRLLDRMKKTDPMRENRKPTPSPVTTGAGGGSIQHSGECSTLPSMMQSDRNAAQTKNTTTRPAHHIGTPRVTNAPGHLMSRQVAGVSVHQSRPQKPKSLLNSHLPVQSRSNISGCPRGRSKRTLVNVDLHLTLYLGQDTEHIQIEGHLYLKVVKEKPLILQKLGADERVHICPGKDRVDCEYWLYEGESNRTKLENRAVSRLKSHM